MENREPQTKGEGGVKEFVIVTGIVLALVAGAIGAYWFRSGGAEARAGIPAQVGGPVSAESPEPAQPAPATVVSASADVEAVHADIYFDFKSTRLRADAVSLLQDKARVAKHGEGWVVLVQGYADRQGPTEYNKSLAQRRALAVKQFLVELGVPDASIRVVTIGPEGSLCDELRRECQQLNRRVHLEMRKLALSTQPVTP